jgi:hypothetical protein
MVASEVEPHAGEAVAPSAGLSSDRVLERVEAIALVLDTEQLLLAAGRATIGRACSNCWAS